MKCLPSVQCVQKENVLFAPFLFFLPYLDGLQIHIELNVTGNYLYAFLFS